MRFAWLRKKTNREGPPKRYFSHPVNLLMNAYNILWWIPLAVAFTGAVSYRTGFVFFFVVTVIRLVANLARNNFMSIERAEDFPLRSGTIYLK